MLAAVTALGLALRLVHLIAVAGYEQAHVVPGLDRWLDMGIAHSVAAGDLLGGTLAPYDSAPAYAVLLGLGYRVLGSTWTGPLVVQAILGALVPLLLYGAGRRLASVPIGLAAAALAAVYGPAIFYEGLAVKFGVVPFTVSALLCALATAVTSPRAWLAAVMAGVMTAFLVALRPNAIVLLPVGLAWIASRPPESLPARAIALFALGLVAVAAPLALRRTLAAERGDAASLWGIHFYIGSQLHGDGGYTPVLGISDDVAGHVDDARAIAEANRGRALTPGEVSRYWFERGLAEIARHPGGYLRLIGRKLRRLGAENEEGDFGDDYPSYAARSTVLRACIGFGAVAPLAALGIAIALQRLRGLVWIASLAGAYAFSLLPFFVTGRYRLPMVPPLLLLAAAGLVWLADAWVVRRRTAVGASIALLGGAALLGTSAVELMRLAALVAIVLTTATRLSPDAAANLLGQ